MPREWHDRHYVNIIEDEDRRDLYRSIVADKKPYFMRYIYPDLMRQYNTYIKNTERNSLREFQISVKELRSIPKCKLTDRQKDFLRYYDSGMPVGVGDCVMNKICRKFEDAFDSSLSRPTSAEAFDYKMLKSNEPYTGAQYYAVKKLYDDYCVKRKEYEVRAYYDRTYDKGEVLDQIADLKQRFKRECLLACPNDRALCDIIIDMCYSRNRTKVFVWDMCADQIIENLLNNNGMKMSYPVLDDNGDMTYCGKAFSTETIKLCGDTYEYCS